MKEASEFNLEEEVKEKHVLEEPTQLIGNIQGPKSVRLPEVSVLDDATQLLDRNFGEGKSEFKMPAFRSPVPKNDPFLMPAPLNRAKNQKPVMNMDDAT